LELECIVLYSSLYDSRLLYICHLGRRRSGLNVLKFHVLSISFLSVWLGLLGEHFILVNSCSLGHIRLNYITYIIYLSINIS